MTNVISLQPERTRHELIADLQRLLRKTEFCNRSGVFSFGLPAIDAHLPEKGLSLAALHDIVPETPDQLPAAFGFIIALICGLAGSGPVLIVSSPEGLGFCRIHGHGLNMIGLDPARVILIEAENEIEIHWVIEEALKSGVPVAVTAIAGAEPDLKTSRRLHLAAGRAGLPLLLLRPEKKGRSSAALTRWRIGGAEAARDSFGLFAGWRWHVSLERCRNGRPGEWLVEFDHGTHRFSLAAAVADRTLPQSASAPFFAARSG